MKRQTRRAAMAALFDKLRTLYGEEVAAARLARINADAAVWNTMGRAAR